MLIQSTAYTHNVGYENRLAQKHGAGTTAFKEAAAAVDRVTISDAGRAMNEAVSNAANPDHKLWQFKSETGATLKAIPLFSYAQAHKFAEAGMKEALSQLNIPENTKVTVDFNNDGTVSVDGAGDKNAELEAMVNENGDLRNILVAATNAAAMERIGAAQSQVNAAVARDPSGFDRAYAWLAGVSQKISNMGFEFEFSGGTLTGSFLSDGKKLGLTEGMEQLVA